MRPFIYALVITGVVLSGTSAAQAVPQVISDTFIGGRPNYTVGPGTAAPADLLNTIRTAYHDADVVGRYDGFDVDHMTVEFLGSNVLSVVVHSTFFDNIGELGIGLGDLFISTDGWNPVADSREDYAGNGEDWELAVQLNSRNSLAGSLGVYDVIDKNVELSWVDPPAPGFARAYRGEQEVRYNSTGEQALGGGNWSVDTPAQTLTLNVVFDQAFWDVGGPIWGFHWTMTCGNDVIEGAGQTPIPEPASLLLLLSAVAGSFCVRRRTQR